MKAITGSKLLSKLSSKLKETYLSFERVEAENDGRKPNFEFLETAKPWQNKAIDLVKSTCFVETKTGDILPVFQEKRKPFPIRAKGHLNRITVGGFDIEFTLDKNGTFTDSVRLIKDGSYLVFPKQLIPRFSVVPFRMEYEISDIPWYWGGYWVSPPTSTVGAVIWDRNTTDGWAAKSINSELGIDKTLAELTLMAQTESIQGKLYAFLVEASAIRTPQGRDLQRTIESVIEDFGLSMTAEEW